ncbi:hypothetical protein CIHG_07938 [Coccidioides immitis H538.4]|uniref:Uncharacterized protein n=4 Tax=Coccidioides TaxID=5500 RepID=A0A0J8R8H9_COCIT|nr:hypothetical protein CPAG_00062 [Coccidioides posadasii RMSCC 3488]KMP02325.1 hypothetical protein CIRG_10148 [Coccidioides immitis RMSCC 2394]KMU81324.1 hypothetical protein CISG_08735 [Coccidioides immitis RMSCC 3703]KMU90128.1 hypothetical protein CIHG_07938 [Coccidioides immitis H538.4]TPX24623.1 hypothetical protein DIZ76_010054 [Coccidioides immitis]
MCIPVNITKAGWTVELAFTVPLPYKVSEETYPGNVEARIRSEPATYTRISKNSHLAVLLPNAAIRPSTGSSTADSAAAVRGSTASNSSSPGGVEAEWKPSLFALETW